MNKIKRRKQLPFVSFSCHYIFIFKDTLCIS